MIEGHFYSKDPIEILFKDRVRFKENTILKLKGNDKEISLKHFNTHFFTYDNIIPYNFKIIVDILPRKMKDLVIFTVFDTDISIKILNFFIKINKENGVSPNILIALTEENNNYDLFINFFKSNDIKFCITSFPNFNFDLLSYIINFLEISKIHSFENVLNLSSERNPKDYLNKPLNSFIPGFFLENQVEKMDKFNLSFIDQVITLNQGMMWNKDSIYYENFSYLNKLFNSIPIQETLLKCLKIPKKYINPISPRCSPKHSMERLIGYMKPLVLQKFNILYFIIFEINNEEDIERLSKNIKNFKNGELILVNTGSMKNINMKKINCNYYYTESKETPKELIWRKYLKRF